MNYRELAEQRFLALQDELLELDKDALGGEDETNYEVDGVRFKIKVDGFWEKATWFNYEVFNEQNQSIEKCDNIIIY